MKTWWNALLLVLLAVLVSAVGASTAGAEPTHVEKALKVLVERLKAEPDLEHLSEQSLTVQNEVERGLSDEQWLDNLYHSPSAPEVETLAGSMDPEDHAQFETYVKALETDTESVALDSPAEAALGDDLIETGGDAGLISGATVSAIGAAAALGYLTYEDITTGTNPVDKFLFGTFAPEPAELHLGSPPEEYEGSRIRDVGTYYKEYTELYGENAEELGLCKGEEACLRYVYPWQMENTREGCGISAKYGCGYMEDEEPFYEGQVEYYEAKYSKIWHLEKGMWYDAFEQERVSEGEYPWAIARALPLTIGARLTPNDEPCYGRSLASGGGQWPKGYESFPEVEPHFYNTPKFAETSKGIEEERVYGAKGNTCRSTHPYPPPDYIEKYTDAAPLVVEREPDAEGNRFRQRTYVHIPGHHPMGSPEGRSKTDINEPSPEEQSKKLAEPHAVKPAVEHKIHEATEEPPYGPDRLLVPSCKGLNAQECEIAFLYAGFTTIELEPKTWEEADLSLPADATIETMPKEGEETDEETKVKIIANPAEMPAIVPSPATGGELGTEYQEELDADGWTDNELDVLPESLIDTRVGPNDEVRSDPTPGTREAPGTEASTKVTIVVNPATAPAPEGHTKIGGVTEPGVKFPHIAILCRFFPFGVPCWIYEEFSTWNHAATVPVLSIGEFKVHGVSIGPAEFSLAPLEPIMVVVRPMMLIFSTIGLVVLFYRFATGTGAGTTGDAGGDSD